MEDYDWIQLAFVFDEEPTLQTYETLLDTAPSYPGLEYDTNEYNVKYRTGDTGTKHLYAEAEETLDAITNAEYWSIEVRMEHYGISIAFETGRGLLPDASTPTLTLSTTIYAFEDREDIEPLGETKQRRREFGEFLATTADIFEPEWGFGRRGGLAIGEDETVEALAEMTTPHCTSTTSSAPRPSKPSAANGCAPRPLGSSRSSTGEESSSPSVSHRISATPVRSPVSRPQTTSASRSRDPNATTEYRERADPMGEMADSSGEYVRKQGEARSVARYADDGADVTVGPGNGDYDLPTAKIRPVAQGICGDRC